MPRPLSLCLLLLLPHVAQAQTTPRYRIASLGFSADTVLRINNRGTVVGDERNDAQGKRSGAWLWKAGRVRALGPKPGKDAWTIGGLNDRDEVAATRHSVTDGAWIFDRSDALLWKSGRVRLLGLFGKDYSTTAGINTRGQIVGSFGRISLPGQSGGPRYFLWNSGRHRLLTFGEPVDINDASQILARRVQKDDLGIDLGSTTLLLWTQGHVRRVGYLDDSEEASRRLNARGDVLARETPGRPVGRLTLFGRGKPRHLQTMPGDSAVALNAAGNSVGTSGDERPQALLWQGTRRINLNHLIAPRSGWVLETADDIND